jgi:hypothetical protein
VCAVCSCSARDGSEQPLSRLAIHGFCFRSATPSLCCAVQNALICSTQSGTIPLKLPKALVLSQFSHVTTLPFVLPLDLLVDGQPAGVCEGGDVQGRPPGGRWGAGPGGAGALEAPCWDGRWWWWCYKWICLLLNSTLGNSTRCAASESAGGQTACS